LAGALGLRLVDAASKRGKVKASPVAILAPVANDAPGPVAAGEA
jgi:hypothetical protein